MEFFNSAKTVKLVSHHGKYLVADDNKEYVQQRSDGSSRNALWEVEFVKGKSDVVRLKSLHGCYLTASESSLPIGGDKVIQTVTPTAAAEWKPIKHESAVKLETAEGKFLRGNSDSDMSLFRYPVTHSVPYRGKTQNWVLWKVEVVDVLAKPHSSSDGHARASAPSSAPMPAPASTLASTLVPAPASALASVIASKPTSALASVLASEPLHAPASALASAPGRAPTSVLASAPMPASASTLASKFVPAPVSALASVLTPEPVAAPASILASAPVPATSAFASVLAFESVPTPASAPVFALAKKRQNGTTNVINNVINKQQGQSYAGGVGDSASVKGFSEIDSEVQGGVSAPINYQDGYNKDKDKDKADDVRGGVSAPINYQDGYNKDKDNDNDKADNEDEGGDEEEEEEY